MSTLAGLRGLRTHPARKCLKSEDGSAQVIEMTFIFPFVLSVLAFLLYMGSYYMQSVLIYNSAQQVAVTASRAVAFPGYEILYGASGVTAKTDFDWADGEIPTDGAIGQMMKKHKPYRYWNKNMLEQDKISGLENSLKQMLSSASLFAQSNLSCEITPDYNVVSQSIRVHVTKNMNTPRILRAIGLKNIIDIDISAVAAVNDPAEFVRNTDIVFDLTEFMFDNLKLSNGKSINENIAVYKEKISGALEKLGIK